MEPTLTDPALEYLLQSAGLTLTDAEKAELKFGFTIPSRRWKARVRGRSADRWPSWRIPTASLRRTSHEHPHDR